MDYSPSEMIVITDLGCYEFQAEEMTLVSLHPGVDIDTVRAHLGWGPKTSKRLSTTEPPTAEELQLLRHDLDPNRLYL